MCTDLIKMYLLNLKHTESGLWPPGGLRHQDHCLFYLVCDLAKSTSVKTRVGREHEGDCSVSKEIRDKGQRARGQVVVTPCLQASPHPVVSPCRRAEEILLIWFIRLLYIKIFCLCFIKHSQSWLKLKLAIYKFQFSSYTFIRIFLMTSPV